jgi:hypothetical protein
MGRWVFVLQRGKQVQKNRILKKGDIIVIAAILLAALSGLAFSARRTTAARGELYAEIYLEGALTQRIALAEGERVIRLEGAAGYNLLQIGPQGVCMLEADCYTQDCVKAGRQTEPGGLIACLPHRLLVRLINPKGGDFDAIAR